MLPGRRLACWGDGQDGISTDVPPPAFASAAWAAVAVGRQHVCALTQPPGSRVVCYGWDSKHGQASVPAAYRNARWSSIAAGAWSSAGILAGSGKLVAWGRWFDDVSQRDHGPVTVPAANMSFVAVSATASHLCGVVKGGKQLVCFGNGDAGQLQVPALPSAPGSKWLAVAAGGQFTCGLLQQGTAANGAVSVLKCWGQITNRPPPQSGFADVAGVKAVSAGALHVCYIKSADGTMTCVGGSVNGETVVP